MFSNTSHWSLPEWELLNNCPCCTADGFCHVAAQFAMSGLWKHCVQHSGRSLLELLRENSDIKQRKQLQQDPDFTMMNKDILTHFNFQNFCKYYLNTNKVLGLKYCSSHYQEYFRLYLYWNYSINTKIISKFVLGNNSKLKVLQEACFVQTWSYSKLLKKCVWWIISFLRHSGTS